MLHQVATPAVCADGQAAADDLAQARQIGADPVQRLRPAVRDAEARDHLVEDQERPRLVADRAEPFEEPGRRRHDTHVACHRLDDDGRDLATALAEGPPHRLLIVEGHGERERRHAPRHSAAVRQRERRATGPGLDEETVGVAVVTAVELEDDVAAGCAASHPDRGHRRFGPRADEPYHLHRRIRLGDRLGDLHLAAGRRTVAHAPTCGVDHRLDDRRGGVAEDQRAPRAEEVEIVVTVDVPDARPGSAIDEEGAPADAAEGPHRAVDAARNDPLRSREQRVGSVHL